MASEPLVAVLFRVNKKDPTDIFAILPDDDQGRGNVSIFDMKSGHGAGPYGQNIATSRRATPAEYARIKRAMESAPYNYNLRVYDRAPPYRLREKRLREYPLARDVGRAAGRAKGRVNMHGEPKPKFKLGDRVRVDGTSVVGEVSFNSGYDAHLGQYRYKIKDDRDGSRIHYNENSLRRLKAGEAGWNVVSNEVGTILAVYGSALRADAIAFAKKIANEHGTTVAIHSITSTKRPRASQSISMKGNVAWVGPTPGAPSTFGNAKGKTRVKLGVAGKRSKYAKGRAAGRSTYEVVVGNIGTVYSGGSARRADEDFLAYQQKSISGQGRAGGESVILLVNDEIVREFGGADGEAKGRRKGRAEGTRFKRAPREGSRVKFSPNPVSFAMYSARHRAQLPPAGTLGTVKSMAGAGTFMRGPGGGLLYVDWDQGGHTGTSLHDVEKVGK